MRDRFRALLATASSAPWRRAPVLLLRRPGILATVAGACAVTAASLAAVPLFLSSVGTESVALQAGERCPRDTGATFRFAATAAQVAARDPDPFAPLHDRLGAGSRWARVDGVALGTVKTDLVDQEPASLLARDDALDHVQVLRGAEGPGIWISDRAVELTGLDLGDTAAIGEAEVPVVGVYRDLTSTTADDFWCSTADMVMVEVLAGDVVPPPLLVLADPKTLAALMSDLAVRDAQGVWAAPLGDDVTAAESEALVHDLACGSDARTELRWCRGGLPAVGQRVGPSGRGPVLAKTDAEFVERFLQSHLPFVTRRSDAIRTSVGGGIWPMAGFAALAGVGLVAASASLWFDRRRREVTLLTVRGASPLGLGVKAVLELCLPLVVGVAAGIVLAYAGVRVLGPSPVMEPRAFRLAAVAAGVALVLAAATIAAVVARRARASGARTGRRSRLALVPWELLLAWLTYVSYDRLGSWGVPVGRGADVSRVDVLGLLFPVLFLVTAVAVLSRILSLVLPFLRRMSRSWSTVLYLGVRRVARYRVAVLGLLAATAVAAGVLGYAATMNRSLDATLQAKARTYVGSDAAVTVTGDEELPASLAGQATTVERFRFAFALTDRRTSVAVLAIDPATFEDGAYWDVTFSDLSLEEVLDRLAAPAKDGVVPAVIVGGDLDGPVTVAPTGIGSDRFVAEPIDGVRAFPGMSRPKPTVVVSTAAIGPLDLSSGVTEVWIRGDHDDALRALDDGGLGYSEERRVAEVADGAAFSTVSWTFGFMRSLGLAAGLLGLGGVAVYLDARRRDRVLGYSFMRRMGLTRRQHQRAVGLELAASVLVGAWMGLGVALVAATLAHGRIDPVPGYRPDPVLRPATTVVLSLGLLAAVLVVVAALIAQRRIDRDDPVEVLRGGV